LLHTLYFFEVNFNFHTPKTLHYTYLDNLNIHVLLCSMPFQDMKPVDRNIHMFFAIKTYMHTNTSSIKTTIFYIMKRSHNLNNTMHTHDSLIILCEAYLLVLYEAYPRVLCKTYPLFIRGLPPSYLCYGIIPKLSL